MSVPGPHWGFSTGTRGHQTQQTGQSQMEPKLQHGALILSGDTKLASGEMVLDSSLFWNIPLRHVHFPGEREPWTRPGWIWSQSDLVTELP